MIMVKGQGLQILGIVAKLAHDDVNKEVLETDIIALSELSESEVRNHLNELEWLHLTKEVSPNASRAEFRLWNVTEKGLQELSSKESG
jgi:repressor of nif and glnA expression